MALFLQSHLPRPACHHIVWYHSGMSDMFKKEAVEAYEAGELLGLCCTDACGMVSNIPTSSIVQSELICRVLIYIMSELLCNIDSQKKSMLLYSILDMQDVTHQSKQL